MIRTTVSIPDDVGEMLKAQAEENGTNIAAEIAKEVENAMWRKRIAAHDDWLAENPQIAKELDDSARKSFKEWLDT